MFFARDIDNRSLGVRYYCTFAQTLNLIPDVFTPTQLIESATQLPNLIRLGLVSTQLNSIHFSKKNSRSRFSPTIFRFFCNLEVGNFKFRRLVKFFGVLSFWCLKNPIFFIIFFWQIFNPAQGQHLTWISIESFRLNCSI